MGLIGLDLLGLGSKHWPVKKSLEVFPDGWALGCFDTTFGDVRSNAKKFVQSGKVGALRVHIWWSNSHKIVPLDHLKKRLPLWEQFAKAHPTVPVYISHSCEYDEQSGVEIKKRVNMVLDLAPTCRVVQTPMNSPVVPGFLVEEHGTKASVSSDGIASADGQNIFDLDAENWVQRNKDGELCFLWGARFNLREAGEAPPPPQRTAAPSPDYIRGIVRLAYPSGVAPSPAFPVEAWKKPLLWKTYAEDSPGEGDKRSNRPVAILSHKASHVDIVLASGTKIGRLAYYGAFPGGMHRYYSGMAGGIGLYAYQIGQKAMAVGGSEYIWLKLGKGNSAKFYGPICAPFRSPFFQS